MKTSEAHVMKRLLTYMWRYKWLTGLALAFTFLTSLLLTAIPLSARWYIDHLVDPTEAGSPLLTAFQFLILSRLTSLSTNIACRAHTIFEQSITSALLS